jgi:hypothetical protein
VKHWPDAIMHERLSLHRIWAVLCAALPLIWAGPASATIPARFDFNGDGKVNGADALLFAAGASGPGVPHDGSLNTRAADIDGDGDVDQQDFGVFQRCSNGNDPADPNCTNYNAPECKLLTAPQTLEDTPMMIQLGATDADLPWDQLTLAVAIAPNLGAKFYQVAADGTPRTDLPQIKNGEVVANPDGKVWFVPPSNYHSSPVVADVAFRFWATDAAGHRGSLDVLITVVPVNDPPVLTATTFLAVNNQPQARWFIQATDVESYEQTISICFTALPQHGTLYANGVTPITQVPACFPTLNYTYVWDEYQAFDCGPDRPASAFPMTDAFTCHANDGLADSDTVTESIEIRYFNSPPVLTGPASVETVEETPVPLEITATDVDHDDIMVAIVDPLPARGTLYYYDPDAFLTLPVSPGQTFTSMPVALTYVPLPNANTADGTADLIQVRLKDVRNESPLNLRDCDYQIPIHIAPVNDPPKVTCDTTMIIAHVSADGAISPAFTNLLHVADDALPDALLEVTLTAAGPEADHIALADSTGLVGLEQLSPAQIRFQGTLAAINAALAQGVYWYPNGSQTFTGALILAVNDQGHTGNENPPIPMIDVLFLPVSVEYESTIPLDP